MQCPSCGSAIEAEERYGHFRICPYCQSALLLDKEAARISGKMAVLAKPKGPLYVGATGSAAGRNFSVLGRVRYGYEQGFWDEWYLRFEDGDLGWIGEDEDEFTVEEAADWTPSPEIFDQLQPGETLSYRHRGATFALKEKGVAICEGGEGQLPFAVEAGEETPFLDAAGHEENMFLSVEFGDEGPRAFIGRQLERDELQVDTENWAEDGFRTEAAAGTRQRVFVEADRSEAISCDCCGGNLGIPERGAEALTCEYCGSQVDLNLERISCKTCTHPITVFDPEKAETVVCSNCHTQMDLSGDRTAVLAELTSTERPRGLLAIGKTLRFENDTWRVAGQLRYTQRDEGVNYHWVDYLMASKEQGYAWLGEENGHWVWGQELRTHPRFNARTGVRKKSFQHKDMSFKVFERGAAKVTWVDGELPWIAQLEDSVSFLDAIAPPYSLSAEWTKNELEWFQGRYVDRELVAKGFGISVSELPRKRGVGASEPYHVSDFRRTSGKVMLGLFGLSIILIIWSLMAGRDIATSFKVHAGEFSKPWLSRPFELDGPKLSSLVIENRSLNDEWSYFDVALIDSQDRAVHEFSTEISFYSGVEGGESWSEGSRKDSTPFVIEEPGKYRLLIQGQAGRGATDSGLSQDGTFVTEFTVKQGTVLTRYFIILAIFCLIWVAWCWLPKMMFEGKRWSDE